MFFSSGRLADVSEVKTRGKLFTIIKPTTYMNLSGRAVRYWMDKEKIPVERLLVIVDELALPLSRMRLRGSGSHAGHNGLKDIELIMGKDKYPRLRFGIGNNFPKGMQVEFVLGKWNETEKPLVNLKIDKSVEIIESFAFAGIERTMNLFN